MRPRGALVTIARTAMMVVMLDHLSIQCADAPASAAFYDAVLATVGGGRVMDFGKVIGFGIRQKPDFWTGPQATGEGFTAPPGVRAKAGPG